MNYMFFVLYKQLKRITKVFHFKVQMYRKIVNRKLVNPKIN